jgi:DNA-binding NarL/FixJ family response regulator
LGAGVHGYHLKDQPLSDLRLAVQRVLEGQRWISSPLLDKLLQPTPSSNTPALSDRQGELLRLLVEGLDNRAIAHRLDLSIKTVENHLTRLYRQLNVQSRLEAANVGRNHPELTHTPVVRVFEPLPNPTDAKVNILVVDDNGRYRNRLRRLIGRLQPQATIYEASQTSHAVEIAQHISPNLAFVDVVLGEEDGIRCTRQIKQIAPAVKVVLISAYPDQEFHRQGLQAGATAFVYKKDLDAAALRQIMDDIIRE